MAGARGLQFGKPADLLGDVDELPGLFELRGIDEVHAHQVGNVAGRDRLGELGDHLGMGDIGEIDVAIRVFGVPHLDQFIDHVLVAAAALPHHEVGGRRRGRRRNEAKRSQAERRVFQDFAKRHGVSHCVPPHRRSYAKSWPRGQHAPWRSKAQAPDRDVFLLNFMKRRASIEKTGRPSAAKSFS